MGNWWSSEDISINNKITEDKEEWQNDAEKVETQIKNEIHKMDLIDELKNNVHFRRRGNN